MIRQMADFITEAQALVIGKSLDGILDDPVLLRAFERLMELVGESAKRLPVDLWERYPEVPSGRSDLSVCPNSPAA